MIPNTSQRSAQCVYQGVNFVGCTGVKLGPDIYFGCTKKKKSDKTKSSKESKPFSVKEVMKAHLDRLTFEDAQTIKNSITCSWYDLAQKIRTHTDHIKNINKLSHPEAIQRVLYSWIEEHADSALVAILVHNLWEISQKEAAVALASRYVIT